VQEHHYYVDIEATPDELWRLFWFRAPRSQSGDVTIEILHPGDEVGNGLVRHCTFRVPRYLLSGGQGQSWEWLTEVTPKTSWKYNAVGRPLWSRAEGRTRLEDLGDGRTRVHFSESYEAFNPIMRVLLEKRVHAFISKDNDRLIHDSLTNGVQALRAARAKAQAASQTTGEAEPPA
jgi:Polyketide cyclase / dehydrase and lipid transport